MLQVVDRPGFFGRKRERKVSFYNNLYGEGKWSEMWEVGGRLVGFHRAVELYDEAYYCYLASRPDLLEWVTSFGECYDTEPSNIQCGCSHDICCSPRHIQDVSTRRALERLGVWFKGAPDSLLQIRMEDSNGYILNPGQVPFHRPELLPAPGIGGPTPWWAKKDSVEAFWQRCKVICLEMAPALA
jgi:hypothetical protein